MSARVLATAEKAIAAGLSIIPICADGSKAPNLGTWKEYQRRRASLAEAQRWFEGTTAGLAIVGGEVSGGLEILDFDRTDLWAEFQKRANATGSGELVQRVAEGYSERSPNGLHLIYRAPDVRTRKLAKLDAKTTLIETRGEGGYCIVAPSNGRVHPSGKPYELIAGGFAGIVTLTDDEHETLLELARSFDECEPEPQKERPPHVDSIDGQDRTRPGDDFNARASWKDVLEPHGWTFVYSHGEASYWRRPGKKQGISASTEKFPGMLLVFTTSTEFESTLDQPKGYTKFSAYAVLNHGSDFSTAARDLGAKGYGEQTATGSTKAESTSEHTKSSEDEPSHGDVDPPEPERLNDNGNAHRLVRLHGHDLRYVYLFRRWFVWNGIHWCEDTSGEVMRRARSVPMDLYSQAGATTDSGERKMIAAFANRTESETSLKAIVSLARSEHGIPASPDDFDPDGYVLNTPTGIVDLRTGEIALHSRDAMCSKVTGAGYEPGARSELWESCLKTWLPDPEVRVFVQRAIGYSIIGVATEQILILLWGVGANGKTVFIETIRQALGDYALGTPAETLISNRGGGIPNDVARLKGARFVSASENDENRKLAEARVKQLTGGDKITARFMRAEWFEFLPVFTTWLSTNHKPVIRGQDLGIWRRIRLIPFTVTIPEAERDSRLLERLKAELPAVLAWAVEGALEYQERGLDAPDAITDATDVYRRESDIFGDFLEERCVVEPGLFASSSALYTAYREWSKAAGEDSMTKTAFGKKLSERGFDSRKVGGHRGWSGIALGGTDRE